MRNTKEKVAVYTLIISILIIFAIEEIIPPVLAIILCLIFLILMRKKDSTPQNTIQKTSSNKQINIPKEETTESTFIINESISSKLSKIGITDQTRFIEKLETIFKKHLISINSRNMKLIYNLSSKEIAESTIEMLNTYKKNGFRNKIENIEILDTEIISVSKINNQNAVTLEIKVILSDYLTDKEDKIVKGNSSRPKKRRYQITYLEENPKHKQNEIKCNNCGALYEQRETKCPYCRTITNNNFKPREWYIWNKKILENTPE